MCFVLIDISSTSEIIHIVHIANGRKALPESSIYVMHY